MNLVEKYTEELKALIEEAEAERVTISPYTMEINNKNGTFVVEQGIGIVHGENHKEIPIWKLG